MFKKTLFFCLLIAVYTYNIPSTVLLREKTLDPADGALISAP